MTIRRHINKICFSLALLGAGGGAARAAGLRQALVRRWPPKLRGCRPGQTTRAQLEAALGPPLESEGASAYYSLVGFRYDTVVEYQGEVVRRVTFRPFRQPLPLADLTPFLRGETRVPLPLGLSESAHARGTMSYFEVPAERVRLGCLAGARPRVFWYELF